MQGDMRRENGPFALALVKFLLDLGNAVPRAGFLSNGDIGAF
jgi:hypothetical protein